MGIYTAMRTAVGGLNAQSYALEQISGNIANSQTTGFKRTDVSFRDLVTDSQASLQGPTNVQVMSRPTNDRQGDIAGFTVPTYMAVAGDGYFVVGTKTGEVDGRAVFDSLDLYTRRGDFERDSEGYFRNGAGYYLKGLPVDADTGNTIGSAPELIQVTNDLLPAKATTQIEYRANLPSYPFNANADPDVPNTELLNPVSFTNDPRASGDGFVQAQDETTFLDSSISGGAITSYMPSGASLNVQMRWAKLTNTTGSETWNLFYLEDSQATGTSAQWRNAGIDFTFDAAGGLTSPTGTTFTLTGLTVDGQVLGNTTVLFGTNGLTQFDDSDGAVQVTDLRQNGYPAGEFSSVSISDGGRVVVTYGNGQNVEIAEVALATFNADNALQKRDGGVFASTADSGVAILGATGRIVSSALESSNTEIADEFTKLIVTQQAYSANSRIITTADEMIDEVLNIVR